MASPTINISLKFAEDGKSLQAVIQNAEGLKQVMSAAVVEAEKLNKGLINLAAMSTVMQNAANALNNIARTLTTLTEESNSFTNAMREANTMAGKNAEGFDAMKGQVADLAKEVPMLRDKLANGLYQTISNGVPEPQWMEYLAASSRAAVGGLADIGSVVGVTATVIKNYGAEWSDAEAIQDKIQLTAKNGVTSFEQLAAALPRVTGNAATLGVSIDELMGTFATLTGVSGNTAEVSTQLAAIFTALVKPSSEATKMAAEMGIQFDAAAIKAAGGFQNFLTKLGESVTAYSQASGVLEQEVYGKLFGSAESLRALIPLQGELAAKFSENVATMENSAGTMRSAFEEMAGTMDAKIQMAENRWAAFTEFFSSIGTTIQPLVQFGLNVVGVGANVGTLLVSLKELNITLSITALRAAIATAFTKVSNSIKATIAAVRVLSAAFQGAAVSATALNIVLKAILVTTGVGAVIAGIAYVLDYFFSSATSAAGATKELTEAEQELQAAESTFATKGAELTAKVQADIKNLKNLMDANADTTEEVKRLNVAYGDRLGKHKTAAEWYDTLISKSKAYVKQMAYEEQAAEYEKEAAGAQLEIDDIKANMRQLKADKKLVRKGSKYVQTSGMGTGVYIPVYYKTDDLIKQEKQLKAAQEKKATAERKAQRAAERAKKEGAALPPPTFTPKATGVGTPGTPHPTKTDTPEVEPTDLSTLDAIGKRLQWLRKQRSMATAENIQHWNDEIAKAQEAEKALEEIGKVAETPYTPPTDLSQIATYEELNKAVSHYNKLMETASAADRTAIQQNINGLNDLKAQWDAMLDDLKAPAPLSALNSVEALTDAVSYYEKRLQTASASEVRAVAATVEEHKRKLAAIQREVELPAQLAEAQKINALSGEEYRVKIKAMGFEELTGKITDLRRQLADTENPVTADQRRDIEELIATYAKWRLEGASAFDTFSAGWSGIKGVNGSILSMKEALEGTGTAWEKTTAVVDGFLQLYQGIMAVVDVIKTMKQLTESLTVAKEAAAAATQGETMAENINTLSTQQSTAAKSEQIGTNSALTGSNMSVAASGFLAAHAWIPWVGLGIAVAAIGASVAMMASMKTKKFANGGIVSGPTLGLIGEYPGASSNPEVVAPLDKLRSIIEPVGGGAGGTVVVGGEMRVSGRDLVCVLANETRVASRTGRRTNIHL